MSLIQVLSGMQTADCIVESPCVLNVVPDQICECNNNN